MKNMQNKRYTIHFFSPPADQLYSHSPSTGCGFRGTCGFHWTRRIHENKGSLPLSQPPFIYGAWCLWLGILLSASLG